MWCALGHQLSKPAVKTSNARSRLAFTVMLFLTDASATLVIIPPRRQCVVAGGPRPPRPHSSPPSVRFVRGPRLGRALEVRQGSIPETIEVGAEGVHARGIE